MQIYELVKDVMDVYFTNTVAGHNWGIEATKDNWYNIVASWRHMAT